VERSPERRRAFARAFRGDAAEEEDKRDGIAWSDDANDGVDDENDDDSGISRESGGSGGGGGDDADGKCRGWPNGSEDDCEENTRAMLTTPASAT